MNMRILVIPSWYSTDKNSFEGVFIKEQAEQLALSGLDIVVGYYSHRNKTVNKKEFYHINVNSTDNIRMKTIVVTGPWLPKIGRILISWWAKQFESIVKEMMPDVIHAHGYIAGFAARRLSAKFQIPFVLTEHNPRLIKKTYRFWHKNEIRLVFNQCSALIAVGEQLKRAMVRFTQKPILVVPNMVEDKIFTPKNKMPSKQVEFLVVGGLVRRKRVDEAIRSFSIVCRASNDSPLLRIIGDGKERSKLEKLALKLGIADHTIFEGVLSPEEVAQKMRQASALVTVSRSESFGKVIIEALSCGLPVIASESADPENIINPENGIRIPSDLSSLPEAMAKMVDFASTLNPWKLHEEVKVRYGHEVIIPQITEVYKKVLCRNQPIG